MKKLFAVPFRDYKSTKTDEGIIYNLIDEYGVVHFQCWVAHKAYASHDLGITDISGAPTNVRNKMNEMLDGMFGKDGWQIVTRFSLQQARESKRLSDIRFINLCQSVWYNDEFKKVQTGNAQTVL
jgi:hypothetical protein